jgi:hypothetical protein
VSLNAVQRLAIRLWDAVFGEPPPLPIIDRHTVRRMSVEEVAAFHAEVKEYLDKVEAEERRRLQIEAENVRRGRK